jgi:hypothetical protein
MDPSIIFGNYVVSKEHQVNISNFIYELVATYSLEEHYFTLEFKQMLPFGTCFPAVNLKNRKAKILINKDLLNEKLFMELKGCLAHEFAHFFHYVNFTNFDFFKFAYRIGSFVYVRKFSKEKIIIFKKYNQAYEQITDLTACNFGYQKELTRLKRFVPIYRKNLSGGIIPDEKDYLSYDFLKDLKKENISLEAEKRKEFLAFKSLKYKPKFLLTTRC